MDVDERKDSDSQYTDRLGQSGGGAGKRYVGSARNDSDDDIGDMMDDVDDDDDERPSAAMHMKTN
jgi:hypothetical protein